MMELFYIDALDFPLSFRYTLGMMKLAKEIAGHWYSKNGVVEVCDTANCEGLTALIAVKLEPVREALNGIRSVVACEGVSTEKREWEEHDNECSPRMALNEIGVKANAILALLSEGEK